MEFGIFRVVNLAVASFNRNVILSRPSLIEQMIKFLDFLAVLKLARQFIFLFFAKLIVQCDWLRQPLLPHLGLVLALII